MQKLSSKLNQLIKYGVAAIILAVPLYPKFPFVKIPGTYVSVRLEDFVILAVAAIWFLAILPNWKNIFKNKINVAIVLFWIVTLVSVVSAVMITKTAPAHIAFLHWARRIQYMIGFFIGVSAVKKTTDLAFYIKLLILVVFFAFLYGLGQKYFSLPIITTQNEEYSKGLALLYTGTAHLVSTFAGHYDLASFIILVTPLFVVLLLSTNSLKELNLSKSLMVSRIILSITILESMWLLVYTASRISIVSFVGAIVIALILMRKYWVIPIFIVITLLFVSFSSNLIARYTQVFQVTFKRIISVEKSILTSNFVYAAEESPRPVEQTPAPQPVVEDRSSSIRLKVEWPRALRAFTKNTLLGTGFSSITLATDNDYLRLLGEVGLLGFVAFMLIFVRLFTLTLSKLPLFRNVNLNKAMFIAAVSAVPGIMLNAVFIDVFEASKLAIMFWLTLGIAVGAINNEKFEK